MAAPSGEDLVEGIHEVLEGQDLAALSAKKVRKALEARFEQDLSDRKKEIDELLMAELAKAQAKADKASSSNGSAGDGASGAKRARRESGSGSSEGPSRSDEEDDAEVAKRLDEAENGRRGRGGRSRPAPKEKAGPRKRSGAGPGKSTYSKECLLSAELAHVLGTDRMARKDVVSAMWKLIKERNLQDPSNKQYATCDADLMPVFKCKRFKAFGMMKYLKAHIKDAHFVADPDA